MVKICQTNGDNWKQIMEKENQEIYKNVYSITMIELMKEDTLG